MSYDIYCYKSRLGKPDLDEARTAIEIDEDIQIVSDPETKIKIAKALIDYNPRLESFEYDYEEIAKLQGTTSDEAIESFDDIELNTPEGDLAIQILISDNNVSISVPNWYSGDKLSEVDNLVSEYAKIIRQTAGYFVYDPQIEKVFDPLEATTVKHEVSQDTSEQIEEARTEQTQITEARPWWKFW